MSCHGGFAERLALVIGNNEYANISKLTTPLNNARTLAAKLRELRFDVTLVENVDYRGLVTAINEFQGRINARHPAIVKLWSEFLG